MGPKTEERAMNLRRANRKMPRRRLDIPTEKLNYLNPDYLKKFTTESVRSTRAAPLVLSLIHI